jgi:hypothetical protein
MKIFWSLAPALIWLPVMIYLHRYVSNVDSFTLVVVSIIVVILSITITECIKNLVTNKVT